MRPEERVLTIKPQASPRVDPDCCGTTVCALGVCVGVWVRSKRTLDEECASTWGTRATVAQSASLLSVTHGGPDIPDGPFGAFR